MICTRCARAADRQAPAAAHCRPVPGLRSTKCDCAHRTDRYRDKPTTSEELTP